MSISLELENATSPNDRSTENSDKTNKAVNTEIFERLKQIYADKFDNSPTKLRKKLDEVFFDEIKRAKDGSGTLISDKTIRNFFATNKPPTPSTTTINYLCKVLLGYGSYGEAVRSLEFKQIETPQTDAIKVDTIKFDEPTEKLNLTIDLEPYRKKVKEKWSTVKVLDMSEAISLEKIYSDTYFLKSVKGKRQLEYEDILSDFVGAIESQSINDLEERISALKKVKECHKLTILGHGGFGKTLFLKHLALRYLDPQIAIEDFGEALVPVYMPLKVWANEIAKSGLLNAIAELFREDITDSMPIAAELQSVIETMLKEGKFLILLDAIDESGKDLTSVCGAIRQFEEKYHRNRIVLTCRIDTIECQFERFEEVEIASFTEEQVTNFATKWFELRGKPKLGERFLEQIRANPTILSMTINPLSLTYLCLIFRDNLGFPKNRSGIYENVVNIFLLKWDASRDIDDRIPVPDKLSNERKKLLFREIAYKGMTEDPPRFLWEARSLKMQIRQFMEKVSTTKLEEIEDHSEFVLRMVIREHGLLVPQTRSLYAFPYLTFQEYFTAKEVIGMMAKRPLILKETISRYLTDNKWESVFLMIAELLEDADEFFKLIFEAVNALIANSEALQKMLTWLHSITKSLEIDSSSWRALCLAIDLDTDLYIKRTIPITRNHAQDIPIGMRTFNIERNKIVFKHPKFVVALYLIIAHAYATDKAEGKDPKLNKSSDYIKRILKITDNTTVERKLRLAIQKAKTIEDIDSVFMKDLGNLSLNQPSDLESKEIWQQWADSFRQLMLTHLNIGHQVEFSEQDQQLLSDYLYANNLLLKCISGDSLSTRSLREDILDHMLLPIADVPNYLKTDSHL